MTRLSAVMAEACISFRQCGVKDHLFFTCFTVSVSTQAFCRLPIAELIVSIQKRPLVAVMT